MQNCPEKWSEGSKECIIKTAFIHLDDKNEEIRKSVAELLRVCKSVCNDIVMTLGNQSLNNAIHKTEIEELLKSS